MSNEKKTKYYLPTILLGVIVAGIFLLAIFTYQVEESEQALILTVGKPTAVTGPGLHFRLPLPIQEVIKYDVRKRQFSGKAARLEETTTRDKRQVVVGISVFYRIKDVMLFKQAAKNVAEMEDFLSGEMSNAKKSVVGKYDYDQLINADAGKMKLDSMKAEILAQLRDKMMKTYGVDVFQVDFISIGVPEKTAEAIAGTMRQQRETLAAAERESGNAKANMIRIKAEQEKQKTLTEAEAEAKRLRAEGDAEAAKFYQVFSENAKLAAFLQKMDALREILSNRTTLILHTGNVPFDIFNSPLDQILQEQKADQAQAADTADLTAEEKALFPDEQKKQQKKSRVIIR